jgi:hypothetical protein
MEELRETTLSRLTAAFRLLWEILVAKGCESDNRVAIADQSSVQSVHASVENLDASWPVDNADAQAHYGICLLT